MFTEKQAVTADKQWLWRLYVDLLKPSISSQWGWDENLQQEMFATHLPAEKFNIISVNDTKAAAYLLNRSATCHYLKMLLVVDDYQNRGIGKSIVDKLKFDAKTDAKPLRLSIIKSNPVQGFYEKQGFVVCAEDNDSTQLVYNADAFNIIS